jgi:hypothetical protein
MNVYLVLTEYDYDPSKIWGVFTSLESAETFINTLDDVEPLADNECDEYDPKNQVKAFWVSGDLVRILEEKLRD